MRSCKVREVDSACVRLRRKNSPEMRDVDEKGLLWRDSEAERPNANRVCAHCICLWCARWGNLSAGLPFPAIAVSREPTPVLLACNARFTADYGYTRANLPALNELIRLTSTEPAVSGCATDAAAAATVATVQTAVAAKASGANTPPPVAADGTDERAGSSPAPVASAPAAVSRGSTSCSSPAPAQHQPPQPVPPSSAEVLVSLERGAGQPDFVVTAVGAAHSGDESGGLPRERRVVPRLLELGRDSALVILEDVTQIMAGLDMGAPRCSRCLPHGTVRSNRRLGNICKMRLPTIPDAARCQMRSRALIAPNISPMRTAHLPRKLHPIIAL